MRNLQSIVIAIGVTSMLTGATAEAAGETSPSGKQFLAYFGTYTGKSSKGIYAARFDPAKGSFTSPILAADVVNPTFLALHPNGKWLYAVNETDDFEGKRAGALSAFSINNASGRLTLLNQKLSGGTGPCHVSIDKSGKCALVANYGSGSIATFKIESDGRLSDPASNIQNNGSSANPQRQTGPHAHQILADAANRFVFVCDLGLDKVMVWKFAPEQALLSAHEPAWASVKPGAGPRHLAFDSRNRFAYVVNELDSTLMAFSYDAKAGKLSEIKTLSTLSEGFKANNSGAEVQVHPSGKYVYTSNRGENTIALFAIEARTGVPRYIKAESVRGKTPRHFTIDPTGRWLIVENQDSNNVVVFAVSQRTGELSPVEGSLEVGAPVCLVFAK